MQHKYISFQESSTCSAYFICKDVSNGSQIRLVTERSNQRLNSGLKNYFFKL